MHAYNQDVAHKTLECMVSKLTFDKILNHSSQICMILQQGILNQDQRATVLKQIEEQLVVYIRRNHFDYSKILKRDYKAFVHFTNLLQALLSLASRDTLLIVLDILVELYLDYEGSKSYQNLIAFVKFNQNVI